MDDAVPAVVITTPLALAALAYWNCGDAIRLGVALNMLSETVEAVEVMLDLSGIAPPPVRERCSARLPVLRQTLSDIVQDRTL